MAIDTKSLSQLISEFRKLHAKDAISPESLGYILQLISNNISDAVSENDLLIAFSEISNSLSENQKLIVKKIIQSLMGIPNGITPLNSSSEIDILYLPEIPLNKFINSLISLLGNAGGIAPLGNDGKVPTAYLPEEVLGGGGGEVVVVDPVAISIQEIDAMFRSAVTEPVKPGGDLDLNPVG